MEDRDAREIFEAAGDQVEVGADAADAGIRIHPGQDRIGERPLAVGAGARPSVGAAAGAADRFAGVSHRRAASAQRRDGRDQLRASSVSRRASSSISRRAIQAQDGATGDGIVRAPSGRRQSSRPRIAILPFIADPAPSPGPSLTRRMSGAASQRPSVGGVPEAARRGSPIVGIGGVAGGAPMTAARSGPASHRHRRAHRGAAAEQPLEAHHADELRADLRPQHDQQRAREDQQAALAGGAQPLAAVRRDHGVVGAAVDAQAGAPPQQPHRLGARERRDVVDVLLALTTVTHLLVAGHRVPRDLARDRDLDAGRGRRGRPFR